MVFPTAYHADSDADDEYERSVMTSPQLPTDSETSPTDSEPPSAEHTPTTYGASGEDRGSPRTIITEWTAEECADFIASLGLSQYCDRFLENEVVGEALIALKHDELKEMGITSVGHRLTMLKSVYETKIKQDIPIDGDHYVPLSAENNVNETATQEDIARIIQSIRLRDERIIQAEMELKRMSDAYQRLREELLPVFRLAKDKSQPLPNVSPEFYNHDISNVISPPAPQEPAPKSSLSRTFSKKLFLGSTPKNNSPTHIPQSIPENKTIHENSLDPSAAAMAASTHLTASMSGGSQPSTSPNQISIPSPTSPAHFHQSQPLPSRSYREGTTPNTDRSLYAHAEDALDPQRRTAPTPTQSMNRREFGEPPVSASSTTSSNKDSNSTRMGNSSRPDNSTDSAAPSVEIFKSFRVSMDDPCYKVLPAALKKYNINADWRQYALYIVYGDQERCLGLEERPLILFKQLDKEGKKPMFMLRRHAQPAEGYNQGTGAHPNEPVPVGTPGYSGGLGSSTMPGGRPAAPPPTSQIHLPGGVL